MIAESTRLTGTVMLETMWETRHKDLLDLLAPFIMYSVAQLYSPGDNIDTLKIREYMNNFGYSDMPESVICKIMARDQKTYKKKDRKYILQRTIDSEVKELEDRKMECAERVETISIQIADYLSSHCRGKKTYSSDEAVACLQGFFARNGMYLGVGRLLETELSPKTNETDYYIARYITEKKEKNDKEYQYILDLVKGYFLQAAIYFQPENGNIKKESYKKVTFFYDTACLLNLLGCHSDDEGREATELHSMLKNLKAKFAYFSHTETETIGVLTAYKYSLEDGYSSSGKTLQGLDQLGYKPEGVQRIIDGFEKRFQIEYGIDCVEALETPTDENGSVNQEFIGKEESIKDYIREHTKHYPEDNLDLDVRSAMSIRQIRIPSVNRDIEKCKAIFVTTNTDFARSFNEYYKQNYEANEFPILITAADLAAITWVKSGSVNNLPEVQLLNNAYMAMQPSAEILVKFKKVLDQMQSEGKLTEELAVLLRTSHVFQKEIWRETFGDERLVTESLIGKMEKALKDSLVAEEKQKNAEETERRNQKRYEKAHRKAMERASKVKNFLLKGMRYIATIICAAIVLIGITQTIQSWGNLKITVPWIVLAIISFLSIIDTVFTRGKWIDRWIVKQTNRIETFIYERIKKDYMSLDEEN